MKRRRRGAVRDQSDSRFSAILARLCDDSGALAAALVDAEGETVDYAGLLSPYEVKVAAAEWRLVLAIAGASRLPNFQGIDSITIRGRTRSFVIEALPDGYAIALCLPRHCCLVSQRAVAQARRELSQEAGLTLLAGAARDTWARVRVRSPSTLTGQPRPEAIWFENAWNPVTILGRYQVRDLSRSELGYLARLESGAEVVLVREPLGVWFVDNAAVLSSERLGSAATLG